MSRIRLDKFLSDMQVATRSQAKDFVIKKRITVDGEPVTKPAMKIDTDQAVVALDGIPLLYEGYQYVMMNKPAGVLSATEDSYGKTVIDLLSDSFRRDLFPVGRLDKDTEGLLLLTNDGVLAHNLLAPKHHIDKCYRALVAGTIKESAVKAFADGLYVDETLTAMPAVLTIESYTKNEAQEPVSWITVILHEGKFHQVKRMFEAIGSRVLYLKRIRMGSLQLDETLQPGEYRRLTKEEVALLKNRD